MFEKFGEFDSSKEINRAAAAQLEEGDHEAIMAIAEENGIDREDAEDYIAGFTEKLATPLMAAVGKLKVEAADLELAGILADWKDLVTEMCMEEDLMAAAVRRKGRSLKECMARLLRFSFENKVQVSEKLVKATKVNHNGREEQMRSPLYMGIPSRAEVKKIARSYYLG